MKTTVYVLNAPSPDPGCAHLPIPVGCVLVGQGEQKREFFLIQPEAAVWQDILQEREHPAQWAAVKERLPGYEVQEHQDERGLDAAFHAWQTYVALAWETRGAIPLPLPRQGGG